MTQNDMVLDMLKRGKVTQMDALREIGCMRLASRISDLKRMGYKIDRHMVTRVNRYGKKVSFSEYSLAGDEDGRKTDVQ